MKSSDTTVPPLVRTRNETQVIFFPLERSNPLQIESRFVRTLRSLDITTAFTAYLLAGRERVQSSGANTPSLCRGSPGDAPDLPYSPNQHDAQC